MTAVDVLGELSPAGVNYIGAEQASSLLDAGAIAGKEVHLELPVQVGIRVLCYVKLDLRYGKVWIRDRKYRAEVGRFAMNGASLPDARELYKQAEDMHYRDMLGEI